MPLFRTRTAAIYGVDALLIDVEVDMYMGDPQGLHHRRPARHRRARKPRAHQVVADQLRLRLSLRKPITINLAPANFARKARASTCRWRWASWARWARSPPTRWRISWWSASCRSTARCARCAARCRSRSARKAAGIPNLIVPRRNAAEAARGGGRATSTACATWVRSCS